MLRYCIITSCLWWLFQISYAQNIVQYEYTIDGENATVKDISPSDEDVSITFDVKEEFADIEDGLHFLGVQVKDENGKWSIPTYRTFLVQTFQDLPNIVKAEYIIDDGEPVAIEGFEPGADINFPAFDVDLSGVSPGLHFLQVRVQDAFQKWSVVTVRTFLVNEDKELEKIVKLNYYYYDIAGETVIGDFEEPIDPPATSIETNFQADATLLVDQKHYLLYFWAESESGKLSLVNIQQFQFKNRPPIALDIALTHVKCFGDTNGKIEAIASEGKGPPYEYSLNGVDFQANGVFEDVSPGDYTIYVRDGGKDFVHEEKITIEEPDSLGLSSSQSDPGCVGEASGSIIVSVEGQEEGITFSIDGENFQSGTTFENLMSGTYTIIVKKLNGCTESIEVTLIDQNFVPEFFEFILDESTNPPTLFASASGATKYEWFKDGKLIVGANETTLTLTEAGVYKVRVSNEAGCSVESPEFTFGIILKIDKSDPRCFGEDNGEIAATGSGGQEPYMYKLDEGTYGENNEFPDLPPGEYTVYVKDSKGAEAKATIEITAPESITITVDEAETKEASCPGKFDGIIAVSATGGDGSFLFKLDDGEFQESPMFTGLSADAYTITAQDGKMCQQSITVNLGNQRNGPDAPSIIREGNDNSVESSLIIENTNGHDVQWIKDGQDIEGEIQETLVLSEAGNYTAVLIDTDGCRSAPGEIKEITGLEEIIAAATKVFPVPAQTWARIEVPYSQGGNITANLMNTQGQVLKRKILQADGNRIVAEFEVSTLPDGLYLILLQGDDFTVIKKIQKVSQ